MNNMRFKACLGGEDMLGSMPDHVEHLVLAQVGLGVGQTPLLDHHPVKLQLHRCPLHNLFVHSVLSHHSVNAHL